MTNAADRANITLEESNMLTLSKIVLVGLLTGDTFFRCLPQIFLSQLSIILESSKKKYKYKYTKAWCAFRERDNKDK